MRIDELVSALGLVAEATYLELTGYERSTALQHHKLNTGPSRIKIGKQAYYRLSDVQRLAEEAGA